jgi:UDP-glucose 4-epimerase
MSSDREPVVITGGAGFLGQSVALYLDEHGYACTIVDRVEPSLAAAREAVASGRIECVFADLHDRESVDAARARLPERFRLVHIASVIEVVREVTFAAKKTLAYHVDMSMNAAESWADRLRSLTFTSSFEVYGIHERLPLDEALDTEPINPYGIGKLLAEDYLRTFCRQRGITLTILRLSHIYGPGEWHNKAIPNFIKNCISRTPHRLFGGGVDLREFVHVDDVGHAIRLSFDRLEEGTFNIAGGRCLSIRELLDEVEAAFGAEPLPIEEFPADRPRLDVSFELSLAKSGLGYEPQVSLEAGLAGEIDYFRNLDRAE